MTRSLRIAVDGRPLAFPNSGIGRYTSSLLSEFARSGCPHQLFIYCDRPVRLAFEQPAHWKVRQANVGRRAMSTPFAQAVFPCWALADQIDVFWSPRHHLPLLLSPRVRKVVTVHDMVWRRFPNTMTGGGKLVESVLMPVSLRRANRIIAVSQFTRQEITACFPAVAARIDVIYEASTLPASLAAVSSDKSLQHAKPYFLFVGSSEPRKNLARLLEAYRQYLSRQDTSLGLVIAGSYQWGDFDAQRFVEHHNIAHRVQFQRDIDDATLANLYANASALLLPSLYEGFGLPLVEAMQWGLPIITSKGSAMSEVAGDAALTVDPLDTDSICQAMHDLTDNATLCDQLAQRSKARGLQFNWRDSAMQTLAVLSGDHG